MGTASSRGAYATHAGSMSDRVEPLETDMTPAIPVQDWAERLYKELTPQIGPPGLKLFISMSSGAVSRATRTPSPQVPSGNLCQG